MTLWVLAFIAEMLEVKGTLYFFDSFMEKRDGGYRNRYRFFVYCGVLYLAAVTGGWIGMLKCIPIILVMSFLNLVYYKYGGDMVLSCDENEFKAVVIL